MFIFSFLSHKAGRYWTVITHLKLIFLRACDINAMHDLSIAHKHKKLQVGNDQEMAQSKISIGLDSFSKQRLIYFAPF